MLNISGLINNIGQSIKSFKNNFLSRDVPAFGDILNRVDPSNWYKSIPYSFAIFQSGAPQLNRFGGESGSFTNNAVDTFTLPVNPSDISQSDLPSIKITKTQGGSVVNHSPLRYGELTISGSTGVTPYKSISGVRKSTGEAIFQASTGKKDDKYKSGFEIFLELRNWFKLYYLQRSAGVYSGTPTNLVFQNFKDGEFLIVELTEFTMERTSSKPLHYQYNLKFQILGREIFRPLSDSLLSSIDKNFNKAVEYIDTARGVFLRSQEILKQVESQYEEAVLEPIRKASLALKAAVGIPNTLADVGKNIIRNNIGLGAAQAVLLKFKEDFGSAIDRVATTFTTDQRLKEKLSMVPSNVTKAESKDILLEMDEVLLELDTSDLPPSAINALNKDISESQTLAKTFYRDSIDELKRVRDNANDFMGLTDSTYNSLYDRTQTFDPESTREPTDEEFELLNAFKNAALGVNLMISTQDLFKSTYDDQIADVLEKFNNELPLQAKIATKEIIMPPTSLERLALQQLGDSTRWLEIAELNGLKYPYVILDDALSIDKAIQIVSQQYTNPLDIPSPTANEKYIVASGALGGWLGQDEALATYKGGLVSDPSNWNFYVPSIDLVVYVVDEELYYNWNTATLDWEEYEEVDYEHVIRPGQTILIPTDPVFGFSDIQAIDDLPIYNGLTELEKYFGIDLALNDDFDLKMKNGDLEVVKGLANVGQAIRLLLAHEKGDLLKHPEIGVGLNIGTKVPNLNDVRVALYNSLIQDPRIEDILNIEMRNENNVIEVSFQVKLKNVDIPVPLKIEI